LEGEAVRTDRELPSIEDLEDLDGGAKVSAAMKSMGVNPTSDPRQANTNPMPIERLLTPQRIRLWGGNLYNSDRKEENFTAW